VASSSQENSVERVVLALPEDAHTRAEWDADAAKVLRKAGIMDAGDADALAWERLARTTLDGLTVPPLGLPGEETTGALRPQRAGAWDIRVLVGNPDPKAANDEALADLEGGATSLWVAADAGTDLGGLLDGVLLDLAPVVLDAPTATVHAARAFLHVLDAQGVTPAAGTSLGADPLGALLRELPVAPDEAFGELRAVTGLARERGVGAIVVDATAAHDLGASEGQELGWSIAAGVAYLRALTDQGLGVREAADLVEFRYAATDEQFPTIAKLRAARRLWQRVLQLSDAEPSLAQQRQHVVTSRPMLSTYDPEVNMLRATVAAFAAGVGGADAVTVLPYDSPLGLPGAFGRRIARNVGHLLIDESHVAVVADPAGGAHAVEQLTAEIAGAGWAEFQRLEAEWEGGHDFDPFRSRVADVVARRTAELADGRRQITGLTKFPKAGETLLERAADPLNDRVVRYGAEYEARRDAEGGAR
jgi:methylmalonyl-CoA mutase